MFFLGFFLKFSFFVIFLFIESFFDIIILMCIINRVYMMFIRNVVDRFVNELFVANIISRRGMRFCKKLVVDLVLLSVLWIFF